MPEVLTPEEAATYLRLPQDTLLREAEHGQIPGRQVADTWRFLKAALDDWLRVQDRRSLLLQQAGALAVDESLPRLRQKIYAGRKRSETGEPVDG
jgi:excisionase family DNA binding protein